MLLREFDLDVRTWDKENRHNFGLQTRCVTALFEKCFRVRFKTDRYWKILVDIVDENPNPVPKDLLGVLAVEIDFNLNSFFSMADIEKKRLALDLLWRGVIKAANIYHWDITPFQEAYNCVVERGFVNEWVWKKPKSSPDRKYKAEVYCQHDLYQFRLVIRLSDKNGNCITEKTAIVTLPSEFIFVNYLGKLEWLTNTCVCLKDRDDNEVSTVCVK